MSGYGASGLRRTHPVSDAYFMFRANRQDDP